MSKLYLIRHGKTEANEKHLYCGSTDLPLSETGKAELRQLHYDIPPVRMLTSGMKRTEQTLAILFGDVPHGQAKQFREVDFGVFEMHSYEDLKDRQDYQVYNERNVPPQGESGQQMTERIVAALGQLMEQDTLLVTHGGVIAAVMAHLFPEENRSRYQWQPVPGHGYLVENGSWQQLQG